jgi:hypothetical protein
MSYHLILSLLFTRCFLGSVSKVDMATRMPLIYKIVFPSISTFETPPSFPYWLIVMRQCGEKVSHLMFQVLPDRMYYLTLVSGKWRRC